MAHAEKTDVPFERSISEIVGLLRKAGADRIVQIEERACFTLQFDLDGRVMRFRVTFLTAAEIEKLCGPRQSADAVDAQWRRQRGRALLLVLKAKLESVASQVESFEQAFLANIVLADDTTVYDRVAAPIALEYQSRTPGQLMLGGPS